MWRRSWRVVAQTFGACLRYRVTGLAAEAAFFALLSLPPLVFGLAGAIGFVAQRFEVTTIAEFRAQVLDLALRLLTPSAVEGSSPRPWTTSSSRAASRSSRSAS